MFPLISSIICKFIIKSGTNVTDHKNNLTLTDEVCKKKD